MLFVPQEYPQRAALITKRVPTNNINAVVVLTTALTVNGERIHSFIIYYIILLSFKFSIWMSNSDQQRFEMDADGGVLCHYCMAYM